MLSKLRSHAPLVLSGLALFFAIGGPSFAADAVKSAARAITGKQVKDSSLTTKDIKNGSLLKADFKAGQLPSGAPGVQGPRGPAGEQGPVGPATGPAGGDLAGNYPNPHLAPAENWHSIPYCSFTAQETGSTAGDWRDVGPGYAPGGYYKDPYGVVHLRGVMKASGGVATGGAALFTSPFVLPDGYQPTHNLPFPVVSEDAGFNSIFGRLDMSSDGVVRLIAGSGTFVALDGITFRAAPADGTTSLCWST